MTSTDRSNLPIITVDDSIVESHDKASKTSRRFNDEANKTPNKKSKLKNLKADESQLKAMDDNLTGNDQNSGTGDEWTAIREEDFASNQKKWKNLYRKHKVAILEMMEGSEDGRRNNGASRSGSNLGLDPQQSMNGKLESMYLTKPYSEVKPRVLDDSLLSRSSDTYIRSAIPYLPKSAALLCLVFNILLPGVGTIVSGLMVFCCGEARIISKTGARTSTFCINLVVGWMQIMTVPFFLVGWLWSLVWGIYFILLSDEKLESVKRQEENNVKAKILSAFDPSFRVWTNN